MNPRQVRGDELQDRLRLLAPQPLVESAAGDGLVDGDDDLERFVLVFGQMRCLMRESCGREAILPADFLGREFGAESVRRRVVA